jgi:nitrogen-specific signal transduction histidine kinase
MVFEDLTAQKQLDEERRRADRLDFLNRVVGHVAHEIKNPLVSIKTFAELIDDQYDDPAFRRHFADIVKRDVQALDNITEKLIDFSRKVTYRFEYADINTPIKNAISFLISNTKYSMKYESERHNTTQLFKLDSADKIDVTYEDLPLIKFDQDQLEKAFIYILLYLMSNMQSSGKIMMSLNSDRSEQHNSSVRITITGVNCRLSNTELEQLFDPFNNEESNLIDVGPCIAQKIIEEHDGHLHVQQENNGHTTFVIALPISR